MVNSTVRMVTQTLDIEGVSTDTTLEVTFAEDGKVQLGSGYGSIILTDSKLLEIQNLMSYFKGTFDDNKTAES